ncbi:MAG: hypothetical protein IJA94_03700 [Bacilli bacterium]|nr:hypothetical protein [Bacilli bacterium]
MNNTTYYILSFLSIYLVVFILHYFFLTKPAIDEKLGKKKKRGRKSSKEKEPRKIGEVEYLVNKFKLDRDMLNYNSLKIMLPLLNGFIITFVTFIIELIPLGTIFKLLIGFALLTALIYAIYEIYGRYLLNVERKRGN